MGAIESNGLIAKLVVSGDEARAYLLNAKTGGKVGEIDSFVADEIGGYQVFMASLDEPIPKGKGIGRELYAKLDAEIKKKTGKRLASASTLFQQPGAIGMWKALVSAGRAQGPLEWPGRPEAKYSYYIFAGGLREDSGSYSQKQRMPATMHDIYPTDQDERTAKKMGETKAKGWIDRIKGGKADEKKPGDFDKGQLRKGIKHEMEHTDDSKIAEEIAMDHLTEDPSYYDHLKEGRAPKMRLLFVEGGGHFKRLKKKLASKGAKNPAGLAASIGRKKYGKGKFQAMAAKGRKHGSVSLNEADYGSLRDQFEDAYPDGQCPKRWIIKLFKQSSMIPEEAWRDYVEETTGKAMGNMPMPEQVEFGPVLDWLGY